MPQRRCGMGGACITATGTSYRSMRPKSTATNGAHPGRGPRLAVAGSRMSNHRPSRLPALQGQRPAWRMNATRRPPRAMRAVGASLRVHHPAVFLSGSGTSCRRSAKTCHTERREPDPLSKRHPQAAIRAVPFSSLRRQRAGSERRARRFPVASPGLRASRPAASGPSRHPEAYLC